MSDTSTPLPGLARDQVPPQQAAEGAARGGYGQTLARVEHYFDRTATRTWERLTSEAPVSGIRATVRAGRDRMRSLLLAQLPRDLSGARLLDAGCGTGALAVELAERGAEVLGVDISPQLVGIAQRRAPAHLAHRLTFRAGDLADPALGRFDGAVAMDSLIYYETRDIARLLEGLGPRLAGPLFFTMAPRTPLLMLMWRAGRLFPRSDRAPTMVPQTPARIAAALTRGQLRDLGRISSGFYISQALEYRP